MKPIKFLLVPQNYPFEDDPSKVIAAYMSLYILFQKINELSEKHNFPKIYHTYMIDIDRQITSIYQAIDELKQNSEGFYDSIGKYINYKELKLKILDDEGKYISQSDEIKIANHAIIMLKTQSEKAISTMKKHLQKQLEALEITNLITPLNELTLEDFSLNNDKVAEISYKIYRDMSVRKSEEKQLIELYNTEKNKYAQINTSLHIFQNEKAKLIKEKSDMEKYLEIVKHEKTDLKNRYEEKAVQMKKDFYDLQMLLEDKAEEIKDLKVSQKKYIESGAFIPESILSKVFDYNKRLSEKEGLEQFLKEKHEILNVLAKKMFEKVRQKLRSVKIEGKVIHSTKMEIKATITSEKKKEIKQTTKVVQSILDEFLKHTNNLLNTEVSKLNKYWKAKGFEIVHKQVIKNLENEINKLRKERTNTEIRFKVIKRELKSKIKSLLQANISKAQLHLKNLEEKIKQEEKQKTLKDMGDEYYKLMKKSIENLHNEYLNQKQKGSLKKIINFFSLNERQAIEVLTNIFGTHFMVYLDEKELNLELSKDMYRVISYVCNYTNSKAYIWYGNFLNRKFNQRDYQVFDAKTIYERAHDTGVQWFMDEEVSAIDLKKVTKTKSSSLLGCAYGNLLKGVGCQLYPILNVLNTNDVVENKYKIFQVANNLLTLPED